MKEKAKPGTERISTLRFILLWMAGHAGVWTGAVLAAMLLSRMRVVFMEAPPPVMLTALGTGVLSALVQKTVVERTLKKPMPNWVLASAAGWFLSGLTILFMLYNVTLRSAYAEETLRVLVMSLFIPAAAIQWLWLRRRVQQAWLWIIAAAVGGLIFLVPMAPSFYMPLVTLLGSGPIIQFLLYGLAAFLYSGVTGATMRYLWLHEREKEKPMLAKAANDDAARLERLNDDAGADDGEAYEQRPQLEAGR